MPNFAYLDEQLNYDVFYIQSNRPIVLRQWKRRMQCGKYIPGFYDHDTSKMIENLLLNGRNLS